MKKLNPVAKKWVAALRSGKIKQTRGQLGRKSGSRCCLGVLCDLAVKDGIIDDFECERKLLPEDVRDWAGISTIAGHYGNSYRDLTEDNDATKRNFEKIAAIIESQPEGLFK